MDYLHVLLASRLAPPPWVAIGAWLVLYAANHAVARRLWALNARMPWYAQPERPASQRATAPLWTLAQLLYAAWAFALALYAGGALYVFLAGGQLASVACILGMNVQSLLAARAMQRPGAVTGRATLSRAMTYRHGCARLSGAALTCALLGALLAQLALLGGAAFCAASAAGHARRARLADTSAPP